jgi:hypothetical protein
VRITRSVVSAVPSPEVVPPGVSVEYKQIGKDKWIRTERVLMQADGITPVTGSGAFLTVTYWTRIDYTFPAYIREFIQGFDVVRTLNRNQRRTIFDIRIQTRREFTANTWAKKVITYHAVPPSKASMGSLAFLNLRTVDWRYDGALFKVNIERVIANETLIQAVTLRDDTFYGAYNETVILPGSSPIDTTQLMGMIGNEQLVDMDINQIENRIYRMTKTFVTME